MRLARNSVKMRGTALSDTIYTVFNMEYFNVIKILLMILKVSH